MSKQKHIAIKASKKSISSMILSILMLLSVIPLHSSTIYADGSRKTVMNGTGNIQNTDSIWFGIRGKDLTDAGSEIQWRVLDTNTNIGEDGLFLLSEKLIGKAPYHNRTWDPSRKWQGSDAQKWCKDFSGENGEEDFKSLTAQELAAIKPTTESNPGDIAPPWRPHPEMYVLNGDKVFFLSTGEAEKYFPGDNERIATDGNNPEKWWLRSPHKSLIQNVRIVKQNGGISYSNVKSKLATRPAFNLDKEKVLFTSPAKDIKKGMVAEEGKLNSVVSTDTTEWKLTLIDDSRNRFNLDTDGIERRDLTLTIPYKDATTGANEYISAVVEKNGTITHYGNVLQVSAGNESGTVTVQLPADFNKKTDTLYLINEQLNGDKKTDYSSAKIEIAWQYNIKLEDALKNKLTAAKGEEVRVTAIRKENKVFDKWKTEGITLTTEQATTSPLTFTMPDNDVKFIATFNDNPAQPTEYSVTVNGGTAQPDTAKKNEKVTVTATIPGGKAFDKWTAVGIDLTDEQKKQNPLTFDMPENNVTFTANFKNPSPTEYSVTVNGGTAQPDTAKKDEKVTVTATIPGGKAFDKWTAVGIDLTDEQKKQNPLTFDMPENNVTFTANFKNPSPTEYSVTVNGGTAQPDTAKKDEKVTVTATIPGGKAFDKWTAVGIDLTDEQKKQNPLTFDMPENNVTFTANFKNPSPTEYSVTVNGGTAQPDTAKKDEKVTVTATIPGGKAFDKWTTVGIDLTDEQKKQNPLTFDMPENNVTFTANFKNPSPTEYSVTVNGGTAQPDTAKKDEKVTVTATIPGGKAFDKWTAVGIDLTDEQKKQNPLTFDMPENNVTFTANFKNPSPTEYSVTVNGGTAQPDTAKKDEKVTVTATIPGGKAFDKWTAVGIDLTDEQKKQNPLTFDMPENNVTFTANFKNPSPTEYSVTVNGGTAQPDTAKKDEKVTVTATIPGGKAFDKWTAVGIDLTDEQKKQNPLTFDMPENNVTFTAYFKKKSSEGSSHDAEYYNITTKTDKHGTVEARSKAREGTEVSVIVDPDKGYKLDEITVTDRRGRDITIKETNRENRYKFTMPARDVTVEATFKQIKQEQPSKPTTPPTIPPTNNNKPTENNIIKKQQTTVFTIGSNIMTVITDGKATQTTIDAKPFLSQGRVMIPVRYAAESLGMQVEWNKQTQTVVLKDRENTVMIPIKTNKIIVGNQEYTSDVTPILKNGRTYLTISNIAKALRMRAGQDVKWDNKIKQVTIIKEVEVR